MIVLPSFGYRVHGPVGRQHRGGGINQCPVKEFGRAERADVAQVGSDARTFPIHGMAARAVARSREQLLAASRVANHETASVETAHVAKIGDDARQFRGAKCEGLHGRAGDAGGDRGPQIVVGNDALELACAKVDAGDLIAGRAVAGGALGGENLRAILNVRLKILRSAVLPLGARGRATKYKDHANDCARQQSV